MTASPTVPGVPSRLTATTWKQTFGLSLVDSAWPIAGALVVLTLVSLVTGADAGAWRIHAAIVVFLLPGWWLAPRVMRRSDGPAQRFVAATIISFGFHGLAVMLGSRVSLSFDACYVLWAAFISVAGCLRTIEIRRRGMARYRVRPSTVVLLVTAAALVCAGWRDPPSNDVPQYLPNKIDMAAARTLAPSPIGMTAFGVDEPMTRWKAHTFHVWFSLLADLTRLPVEGVVHHWAPVPVAILALLTLGICVRDLSGCRPPTWAIVLAIMGPITLWFRSYNAYVYAMRMTNNLCLDKDFALFWLIPAFLWVFWRAVRFGDAAMWWLFALLTPLLFGMHPMTPTYLLLLLPFAVIASVRLNRRGMLRAAIGAGLVVVIFVLSMLIGEAQSGHRQIDQLVQLDARHHLAEGRPLHYWPGHYATVKDLPDASDTIVRDGDALKLDPALVTGCSLLLVMPLAIAVWIALRLLAPGAGVLRRDWQPIIACLSAGAVLGVIYLASGWFLSRAPHLYRGYERLHWFAYLPALMALTLFFTQLSRVAAKLMQRRMTIGRSRRIVNGIATVIIMLHLGEQCWRARAHSPTSLEDIRGLNSLYDYYGDVGYDWVPENEPRWRADQPIVPPRPDYLNEDDRVLSLIRLSPSLYHELRQSVWWPELYGEGQMLLQNGEPWLDEWRTYYDLVDGIVSTDANDWMLDREVTVIIDDRQEADEFLQKLADRTGRSVTEIAPGAWRIGPSK